MISSHAIVLKLRFFIIKLIAGDDLSIACGFDFRKWPVKPIVMNRNHAYFLDCSFPHAFDPDTDIKQNVPKSKETEVLTVVKGNKNG